MIEIDTKYERIINSIYHEDKDLDPVTTECIDNLKEEIKRLLFDHYKAAGWYPLSREIEKEIVNDKKIDENISILEQLVHHAKHI